MENVTRVQDYIQEQYEEEFRLVTRKAEIQNRIMPSKSYLIPTGWTTKWNNVQVHFPRRLVSKSGLCSINFRYNNINTINTKIGLSLGII